MPIFLTSAALAHFGRLCRWFLMAGAKSKFSFLVQSIFSLPTGAVLVGKVQTGAIKSGQSAAISGKKIKILKIEANNKPLQEANAGQFVGLFVEGISVGQIKAGTLVQGE